MNLQKPIIATWGVGPSYRRRVKQHILQSVNSGYDNIMDYAILTDLPEDFDEIAKQTGKIKFITNIHDARKNYEWSHKNEYIPTSIDYENYAKEYVENHQNDKMFSYALHRFALPDLAKFGYTKILFIDSDMKINYDKIGIEFTEEDFWKEFDTPINSVKGCVAETMGIINNTNWKESRCMGIYASSIALQTCSIVLYLLEKKFKKNRFYIPKNFDMTEGPFRYYNFENVEKVIEYFEFWEESQKIIMSDYYMKSSLLCGGYMYCDYTPVACANIYSNLTVENFSNVIYDIEVHYEDRYFLPKGTDATLGLPIKAAKSIDEFFEINKETEEKCKELGVWPNVDPKYIYSLKNN